MAEWRSIPLPPNASLATVVMELLTTEWQGDYSRERADAWISSRDQESATLLVIEGIQAGPWNW